MRILYAFLAGLLILLSHEPARAGNQSDTTQSLMPKVHAELAIQMETYFSGDSIFTTGSSLAAENGFTMREALIVAEGGYGDFLEYNLEVGAASCQSGGFMVMEADILYKPLPHFKMGFSKGHVLRGFELYQECVGLLTSEKPIFAKKYCPCHPMGAVFEYERDFQNNSGILTQLVIAEGPGGTFDDEYDINLGLHYRTPLSGLSVSGHYTFWKWNASYSRKDSVLIPGSSRDDYEYFWVQEKQAYDGFRAGLGIDYDNNNFTMRAEGYIGKAFEDLLDIPCYAEIWADSSNIAKITKAPFEDLEMKAFFIQAGYSLPLSGNRLKYLQPYIQYQCWDQAANLNGDYLCSFLTLGINIGIGPGNSRFKIDYQTCLAFADDGGLFGYGKDAQADKLITRLQIGL